MTGGPVPTAMQSAMLLAVRAGFGVVLMPWFAFDGITKIAGLPLSVGPPAGLWPLSLGAYASFTPEVLLLGAEPSAAQHLFALGMTLTQLVLPVLVVIGLFGRGAAVLLITHLWCAAEVHGQFAGKGALFDADPFDPAPDQVLLWSLVLLPIAVNGAGPISIDALVERLRRASARRRHRRGQQWRHRATETVVDRVGEECADIGQDQAGGNRGGNNPSLRHTPGSKQDKRCGQT